MRTRPVRTRPVPDSTGADSTGADSIQADRRPRRSDRRGQTEQLVVVRLYHDRCTISLDSSGALLHRRGYRLQTAKAPLRETLAAATLIAKRPAGMGRCPLLDPMCGAGTLAIEGAWLARDRAPGLDRAFTFMHWPGFDRRAWDDLVAAARSVERAASVAIQASDRDAGAGAATRANSFRAGVAGDIELSQRPLSGIEPVRARPAGWSPIHLMECGLARARRFATSTHTSARSRDASARGG